MLLTANDRSRASSSAARSLNRSFTGGAVVADETTTSETSGSTAMSGPVGTTLFLTPNINADRTVMLRMVQENSQADSTESVLVPDGDGGFEPQELNVVKSQTVERRGAAQSSAPWSSAA